MKKIILFFLAVTIVAGLAAYCTWQWMEIRRTAVTDVTAHAWLHHELQLTAEQHKALEPIEARFAEKQQNLTAALRDANRQLARAMAEDKAYTPRVAIAVEHVHHCMGDLQKASLEHIFEMRAILTPEQGDKLLSLAQTALEQSP